ncbi:hypothetical protein FDUTEX481_00571 [Tolypothrix sp. PCC 7601]|nr:hypothetical protein FDUTEX481_00571 [Tolypothrix sp. PCC 7601]
MSLTQAYCCDLVRNKSKKGDRTLVTPVTIFFSMSHAFAGSGA